MRECILMRMCFFLLGNKQKYKEWKTTKTFRMKYSDFLIEYAPKRKDVY